MYKNVFLFLKFINVWFKKKKLKIEMMKSYLMNILLLDCKILQDIDILCCISDYMIGLNIFCCSFV